MTRSTPTLTQSGLLAVLLQRQQDKLIQPAMRRAQRKHMRAALWRTLTSPLTRVRGANPIRPFRRAFRRTVAQHT